jgi:hypothetical protein
MHEGEREIRNWIRMKVMKIRNIFRKICLHMYKQNIILMQHCEHGPLESAADRKPWLKKNSLV